VVKNAWCKLIYFLIQILQFNYLQPIFQKLLAILKLVASHDQGSNFSNV